MSATGSKYEDCIDLDGSDNDPDTPPHVSPAKPTFRRPSMNASASTSSLVMPSSSAISYPSGLPNDVISHLTHDELLKNPEFVKYVNTVEVLLHREKVDKVPPNRKSLPHLFHKPPLISHHSFPCHQFGWVIPSPRRFRLSCHESHDTCHVPGLAPIFHFSFTITSPSLLPACALEGLLFYDVISLTHICAPLLRPMTVILGLTHPSSLIYDMTSSSLTRCVLSCL